MSIGSRPPTKRLLGTLAVAAMLLSTMSPLAPARAVEQGFSATGGDAQTAIEQALASTGATSITAVLTDAQGTIWEGSTGVVSADGARPSTTTLYGIGSTSKMFATVAVMQLIEAGAIGLDEPVASYLPSFRMKSPQYRQITVRMLLDHSAGLPGATYASIFTTSPWRGYGKSVLSALANSDLKTTPGAMSVYCNDCFTVAGELVEHVSGMPFTTYVERNILRPLEMSGSTYATKGLPPTATAADLVLNGADFPMVYTNAYASGGLMSTASDMAGFARMLLNHGRAGSVAVLGAPSIAEMGRSQLASTLAPIKNNPYELGLGWDTVSQLSLASVGVRSWMKGGDAFQYHSALLVLPDAGLAVFLAGAGLGLDSGVLEKVAQRIALNALVERRIIPQMPMPLGVDQPPVAVPSTDDINSMAGTYLGSMGAGLRLRPASDGTLSMDRYTAGEWSAMPAALSFRADGSWWPEGTSSSSYHTVHGWGRNYLVHTSPDGYGNVTGEMILGQRVDSTGPTAAPWRERVGSWLLVSDRPDSVGWLDDPSLNIDAIPGLPGYLFVAGQYPFDARQGDLGAMFLQIPIAFGRDLNDLVPVSRNTLRAGSLVLQKRDGVAALESGSITVKIGPGGFAEWRSVPTTGRLSIRGAKAWKLYSSDLAFLNGGASDATGLHAPADAMLLIFGNAGDVVSVTRR